MAALGLTLDDLTAASSGADNHRYVFFF